MKIISSFKKIIVQRSGTQRIIRVLRLLSMLLIANVFLSSCATFQTQGISKNLNQYFDKKMGLTAYYDAGKRLLVLRYDRGICDLRCIEGAGNFFLHFTPLDPETLPKDRKKYGFVSDTIDVYKQIVKSSEITNSEIKIYFKLRRSYILDKGKAISFGQFNKSGKAWKFQFTEQDIELFNEPDTEYLRTNPDYVVYIPKGGAFADTDNEHFLVQPSMNGEELWAVWTQSRVEGYGDNRIMFSKSKNMIDWTEPIKIAGSESRQASWGFLIKSKHSNRAYIFYNLQKENQDYKQHSGTLGIHYSDDFGSTWEFGGEISIPKDKYDNPNQSYPKNWVVWQNPIEDINGRKIVGFTQWDSMYFKTEEQKRRWWSYSARSKFLRFDNIDEGPDPSEIKITILPDNEDGLEVLHPNFPWSVAEEPSVVLLPNGDLLWWSELILVIYGTVSPKIMVILGGQWKYFVTVMEVIISSSQGLQLLYLQ